MCAFASSVLEICAHLHARFGSRIVAAYAHLHAPCDFVPCIDCVFGLRASGCNMSFCVLNRVEGCVQLSVLCVCCLHRAC